MTSTIGANVGQRVAEFVDGLGYADLPAEVVGRTLHCVLDLAGVAAAGSGMPVSRIARGYATQECPAGARGARLLYDGRLVSPIGAAFANAATLDGVDGHDGHTLTKGHAGAAVLPATLALGAGATGHDLITALVVGYEVATRAGMALHHSAADYHSSGSWNVIGAAAAGARLLGLDPTSTGHALGIAEYHGPRSPMMRCIDHPTMVKDGTAWGAPTGVAAALLAARGFTGAPALLLETGDGLWTDLGQRWRILEHYLKPYPVCRWAHPAIEAVLALLGPAGVHPARIGHIEVRTFDAAARLATRRPVTTEQAQYSLPFAVAAAAVHGDVPLTVLAAPTAAGPDLLRLSDSMLVTTADTYTRAFPARRCADVSLVLRDGHTLRSGPTQARGSAHDPLTDEQVTAKHRSLTTPVLGAARTAALREAIYALPANEPLQPLLDALYSPP